MRTLLNLFFVPYLRFLGKFHLYAIPVMAFVFLVKIQELMVLTPMVYIFSLYATSNRHQFKDNISWMLSTFNKKTLIRYHLLAQTMVLITQAILSSVTMVAFFAIMVWVAPESSDQVLPELSAASSKTATGVVAKGISPLAGTKEQMVLLVAALFFLITIYSPVSLKDYLRQMEEKGGKKSVQQQMRDAAIFMFAAAVMLSLDPANWLVILLSIVLVAEIAYLVWMFNRAFVLFHPRHYKAAGVGVVAVMMFVSLGVYQLSLARFKSHPAPEVRLSELVFMGELAPQLTPREFTGIAKQVKDPQFVVELLRNQELASLIEKEQLKAWVLEAKELAIALRVIKTQQANQLMWLSDAAVWQHLEKLYTDLKERNPASADWQVKSFERHLAHGGFKGTLSGSGPFQVALRQGLEEREVKRLPASSSKVTQ